MRDFIAGADPALLAVAGGAVGYIVSAMMVWWLL